MQYAKCPRVLRKDTRPAEKLDASMSTMQNFSTTAPRQCNTREHSWAEDFIDLSEFCQPSATPIKMEASVDEQQYTSPLCANTVRNHGFDYVVEGNESLENLDDNLWCMPSPIAMQEELCADPISDWLTSTKGHANGNAINNNNTINADCSSNILCDNPHPLPPTSASHLTETSYDLNEQFLTSRLVTPVPNIVSHYDRKPLEFVAIDDNLTPSPVVQSDATFFHNKSVIAPLPATSTAATTSPSFIDRVMGRRESGGNSGRNAAAIFVENVLLNKCENVARLPSMDALFKEKLSSGGGGGGGGSGGGGSSGNDVGNCVDFPTMLNQGERYLDDLKTVKMHSSTMDRPSPPSSSSMADKKLSQQKAVGGRQMTTSRGKDNETIPTATNNSVDTPEMLQPLVDKNSDFDLVSYVFEDNKPSVSFDLSLIRASTLHSARSSKTDGLSASRMVACDKFKNESISIKTEPMDECSSAAAAKLDADTVTKRGVKSEGSHQDKLVKKLRRYSTCSSEDLTQLESEKYRELRNKNNEASRRSRANRKSREVEMKTHAAKLEAENRRLKVKAEEMEKLVKRLRDCLMQLVLKRR